MEALLALDRETLRETFSTRTREIERELAEKKLLSYEETRAIARNLDLHVDTRITEMGYGTSSFALSLRPSMNSLTSWGTGSHTRGKVSILSTLSPMEKAGAL